MTHRTRPALTRARFIRTAAALCVAAFGGSLGSTALAADPYPSIFTTASAATRPLSAPPFM